MSPEPTPLIPPLQWARVCSDCWQTLNPDQYVPESGDWGLCHVCLTHGTTHGMRTRTLVAALAAARLRPHAQGLQALINDGTWGLEGYIGRQMNAALDDGRCVLGLYPARDYWGNRIPSRFEVQPGTKGSVAYYEEHS